ncbi:hypothetical protein J437_LFUL002615 [Ladona fulva]|uniref:Ricin B lectin domain-containing protein n=1 Tax=Ladona fulva TaxID=123851 RepID=A0A8K0NUY5_LADFU|nr:hypothetical protein J437_LFUL002615 [Ladona fulva]
MLSKTGEIRRDESCVDYAGHDVILYPCHGSKGNQYWEYNPKTHLIQHGSSKKCLATATEPIQDSSGPLRTSMLPNLKNQNERGILVGVSRHK